MHGVSFNVCPNMADYDRIIPCGLVGRRVTSLALLRPELFSSAAALDGVKAQYCKSFEDVFKVDLTPAQLPPLAGFMTDEGV